MGATSSGGLCLTMYMEIDRVLVAPIERQDLEDWHIYPFILKLISDSFPEKSEQTKVCA